MNISNIIKDFIRDTWRNERKMLNDPAAREKLLSGGKLYFYEPESTIPKNTRMKKDMPWLHTNPVIADQYGDFPDIYLDGDYRIKLCKRDDVCLVITDADDELTV